MALVHLTLPNGTKKDEYYSTLGAMFDDFQKIEAAADEVKETKNADGDVISKTTIESTHHKFVISLVAQGKTKLRDGSEVPTTRAMLEMNCEVLPI